MIPPPPLSPPPSSSNPLTPSATGTSASGAPLQEPRDSVLLEKAHGRAHQLDEVLGHLLVVLIDGVHHRVDQHLLVGLAQLRHVAKVDVRDSPVPQSKDVARVRISVKQPELQPRPASSSLPLSPWPSLFALFLPSSPPSVTFLLGSVLHSFLLAVILSPILLSFPSIPIPRSLPPFAIFLFLLPSSSSSSVPYFLARILRHPPPSSSHPFV